MTRSPYSSLPPTTWLWIGALIPLLFAIAAVSIAPPMLNPDSAMGFLAWDSHAKGAPWNHVRTPDPADLKRDFEYFLTWWSPGQADIPGVFRHLGASWGKCIALSTLVACWLQLAGSWLLAVRLGASRHAAGCFAMVSVLQWHSLFPFGHFRGGDMLLNAFTPWILLTGWATRDRPWAYLTSIPVLLLGGQYLKLSAVLLTGPLLMAGGFSNLWRMRKRPTLAVAWSLGAVLMAAGSWWMLSVGFLQRGPTPSGTGAMQGDALSLLAFSAGAPILAATGGGSLIGRIYFWHGANVDGLWQHGAWIVIPSIILLWSMIGFGVLRWLQPAHKRSVVLISAFGSLMMWAIYLRGSSVSTEDRFMRPTGTLLLAALALALDSAPKRTAAACLATLITIACFGVGSAAQRTWALAQNKTTGQEGIIQQHLSPAAIAHLTYLNQSGAPDSKLIYLPFAGLGLEVLRQRALVTDDMAFERRNRWLGRVNHLIAAFPDVMEQTGQARRVLEQFEDYKADEWSFERHGGWWFWHVRAGN